MLYVPYLRLLNNESIFGNETAAKVAKHPVDVCKATIKAERGNITEDCEYNALEKGNFCIHMKINIAKMERM